MTLSGLQRMNYFLIRQTFPRRAIYAHISKTPTKQPLQVIKERWMSTIAWTYPMTNSKKSRRQRRIWLPKEQEAKSEEDIIPLQGVQLGGVPSGEVESEELTRIRFKAISRILFGCEGPLN
jgi:hypothetical protein